MCGGGKGCFLAFSGREEVTDRLCCTTREECGV